MRFAITLCSKSVLLITSFIVLCCTFILQSSIGIQENFIAHLIQTIPFIFIYAVILFFSKFILLKQSKILSSKKQYSCCILLICFLAHVIQYKISSQSYTLPNFNNPNFSHLSGQPLIEESFSKALENIFHLYAVVSSKIEKKSENGNQYIKNIIKETSFFNSIKDKLYSKNNIELTCKNYVTEDGTNYSQCIEELKHEILSQYDFSATGKMLLLVIDVYSIAIIKKIENQKLDKDDFYSQIKHLNDLIAIQLITLPTIATGSNASNTDRSLSMGYIVKSEDIFSQFEQMMHIKLLLKLSKSSEDILAKIKKTIESARTDSKAGRSISSAPKFFVKRELARYKKLRKQYKQIKLELINEEVLNEKLVILEKIIQSKRNESSYSYKTLVSVADSIK